MLDLKILKNKKKYVYEAYEFEKMIMKNEISDLQKKINNLSILHSWVMNFLNKECEKIVMENKMPSKLYIKYPIKELYGIMTFYGNLKIIVNPEMECLVKVE